MNIRDLEYLSAVAKYLHFGKAAEACHVSQPALSMQLQKLEKTLGVQLFERNNKNVMITTVGTAIVLRANKLLLEAEEIKTVAKSFQNPLAGDFKLGAFPTLAPYYLPTIVPAIHKQLPKLRLLLIEEKTQKLIEMLKMGALDAALVALPLMDESLMIRPLFEDPFLLAVPHDHALARKNSVDVVEIKHERLMLLEEGHCLRSQALEVCSVMGASEQNEFYATSLETLRQMVVAGVGITLIPKLAATPDKNIKYLPFRHKMPSRTIGLVWRKNSVKEECALELCKLMTASD